MNPRSVRSCPDPARTGVPIPRAATTRGTAALHPFTFEHRYVAEMVRNPRLVSGQRHSVAQRLARWGVGGEGAADVVLVVSELLSNAMSYGERDRVGLSVSCSYEEVRVEVDDRTPGTWPAPACPSDDQENGRGLFLVKALGSAWGVGGDGAVVWCSVPTGSTRTPAPDGRTT